MNLAYECTYRAEVNPKKLMAGPGPYGKRIIHTVTGGWCKGERLNGTFSGAGGDWLLVGTDGYARIDVRLQLITHDDAVVLITYNGVIELNHAVAAAANGGETKFEDQYFRTLLRMETGAAPYSWVNHTLFVARGRIAPGAVEYEVSRVT